MAEAGAAAMCETSSFESTLLTVKHRLSSGSLETLAHQGVAKKREDKKRGERME